MHCQIYYEEGHPRALYIAMITKGYQNNGRPSEWKTYPALDLQGHSTMPPACDHKNPIQLAFPRHPYLSAVVSIDSPANGTN